MTASCASASPSSAFRNSNGGRVPAETSALTYSSVARACTTCESSAGWAFKQEMQSNATRYGENRIASILAIGQVYRPARI